MFPSQLIPFEIYHGVHVMHEFNIWRARKRLFERLADIDIALGSDRNSILFDRN